MKPATIGTVVVVMASNLAAQRPVDPARLSERASQTREIVYFLRDPDSHTFDLFHDYTEDRPGVSQYLNIVRPGSRVSNPSAIDLDTGAALEVRTVADTVAIAFAPVRQGRTARIRISETYTDSTRYRRDGETLVWDRAFGRAANAVVLPPGWRLTHSSIPATVRLTDDGRIRLDYINPRPDEIEVLILAKRRAPGSRQ
ncbi:MAG: hypothetical protein FJ206_09580 [Gemmatimonadetes bacterium]|nr:hypothetical protein [Gemmatimonadota bacterium]